MTSWLAPLIATEMEENQLQPQVWSSLNNYWLFLWFLLFYLKLLGRGHFLVEWIRKWECWQWPLFHQCIKPHLSLWRIISAAFVKTAKYYTFVELSLAICILFLLLIFQSNETINTADNLVHMCLLGLGRYLLLFIYLFFSFFFAIKDFCR